MPAESDERPIGRPQAPKRQQRSIARPHGMDDIARVEDESAQPRLVPGPRSLAPLALRQSEIDLLGRVMVIGVLEPRRHEAHAEQNILARLQAAGSDDDRICMAIGKAASRHFRIGAALPGQPRLDLREGERPRPGRRSEGRRAPQPGLPPNGRMRASGSPSPRADSGATRLKASKLGSASARQPRGTIPAPRWRRAWRREAAASRESDGGSSSRWLRNVLKPSFPCYPGSGGWTSLRGRLTRTDSPRAPAPTPNLRRHGAGQLDRLLGPWGGPIGGDLG